MPNRMIQGRIRVNGYKEMKLCPNCKQTFSDENVYCLEDGNVLEASVHPTPADTPTMVLRISPCS